MPTDLVTLFCLNCGNKIETNMEIGTFPQFCSKHCHFEFETEIKSSDMVDLESDDEESEDLIDDEP